MTNREKQVLDWLNMIVIEDRNNGLETKLVYQKVKTKKNWYEWKERERRVAAMRQRDEGQGECF